MRYVCLVIIASIISMTTVLYSEQSSSTKASSHGNKLNAIEILKVVDAIRAPGDSFVFNLRLIPFEDEENKEAQTLSVRVKGNTKSLVEFISPPYIKGRLLLMNENNMWVYIPGTRQPIKISPQQRLLGQVANGDVARVAYSVDYNPEILSQDSANIQLVLKAKSDAIQYNKIVLSVARETYQPQKAEFYTQSGRLLKTAYYKNYSNILGKLRPQTMEIHDALRKGQYTVMEFSQMQIKNIPSSYFQQSYLNHVIR